MVGILVRVVAGSDYHTCSYGQRSTMEEDLVCVHGNIQNDVYYAEKGIESLQSASRGHGSNVGICTGLRRTWNNMCIAAKSRSILPPHQYASSLLRLVTRDPKDPVSFLHV